MPLASPSHPRFYKKVWGPLTLSGPGELGSLPIDAEALPL